MNLQDNSVLLANESAHMLAAYRSGEYHRVSLLSPYRGEHLSQPSED